MTLPKNGIFVGVEDAYGGINPEQQVDDPDVGDMVYFGSPEWEALSPGTSGYFLQTQGPGLPPVWASAATGGGITEGEHQELRQLIHFIDDGPAQGFPSGSYKETLPAADPFPTSIIWWESSSKLKKIIELTITRNANQTPSLEIWKVYNTDGSTVKATVTDAISYSGIFETSRTRTIV